MPLADPEKNLTTLRQVTDLITEKTAKILLTDEELAGEHAVGQNDGDLAVNTLVGEVYQVVSGRWEKDAGRLKTRWFITLTTDPNTDPLLVDVIPGDMIIDADSNVWVREELTCVKTPITFRGARGWQGIPGNEGPIGPEGPEGPIGPRGWQGIRGEKGETGLTGPMGPQGPVGEISLATFTAGMATKLDNFGTPTFSGTAILAPNLISSPSTLTRSADVVLAQMGLTSPFPVRTIYYAANKNGSSAAVTQVANRIRIHLDIASGNQWYWLDPRVGDWGYIRYLSYGTLICFGRYRKDTGRMPIKVQIAYGDSGYALNTAVTAAADSMYTGAPFAMCTFTATTIQFQKQAIWDVPAYDSTETIPAGKQIVGLLLDGAGSFAANRTFKLWVLLQDAAGTTTKWLAHQGSGGIEDYSSAVKPTGIALCFPQYIVYEMSNTVLGFDTAAQITDFLSTIPTHS